MESSRLPKTKSDRLEIEDIGEVINRAQQALLSDQTPEGYWWYTLEANESIGAGFIQLMHFLGQVDPEIERGLAQRIISEQRSDGSWPLFYDGPPDLSITIECYLALRLAGHSEKPYLKKARACILALGGIEKCRVFTKIHLALFGLVPWSECPAMPVWLMLAPIWSGASIYEFSSWARASIVPLLILLDKRPVVKVGFDLDELKNPPPDLPLFQSGRGKLKEGHPTLEKEQAGAWPQRAANPKDLRSRIDWGGFFTMLDKTLKMLDPLPLHPGKAKALLAAEQWVREHIARTVDIYPAMAYGAMAIKALGYPNSDPTIQKALHGLKSFQQNPSSPHFGKGASWSQAPARSKSEGFAEWDKLGGFFHQQCCISPLWDTPWAARALLDSGLAPKDPNLLKAARFLISKQILHFRGDWKHKNPEAASGGWAFEFENDYFPDVDDTIEILRFLQQVALPKAEKKVALDRGLSWLLSMQSKNGGWAAFDKDNLSQWVNRIPFSDHGACLDAPTPDITGRVLELLPLFGLDRFNPLIARALKFIYATQEEFGAWRGRWGVNFIYGTWAVLQGLSAIGENTKNLKLSKAVGWLKSIQNRDGGWGESCLSDRENRYVALGGSVPSQTAWALLGLMAAGEKASETVARGVQFLCESQTEAGRWEENHFTGTGFPGHFYIRYHGYRQYFPLLALGRYYSKTTE